VARWTELPTRVVASVLALTLLTACSQPPSGAPTVTPSVAPSSDSSPTTAQRAAAYARATSELTDFLDAWTTKGYPNASKAYLAPDLQATSADDVLVLASGRVVNVRADEWTSNDLFVVYVDFDLTFAGNFGAWGNGRISRFVTATARSGPIPYVLEFATSR
jgi:hypothetical protein